MPVVVNPSDRELIIRDHSDLMLSVRPLDELILRDNLHRMSSVWVLDIFQYTTEDQTNEYRRILVQFLKDLFKSNSHKWALDHAFMYRQKILMRASDTGPGFKQGQTLYFNTKRYLQQNVFKGDPTKQCQITYEEKKNKFKNSKKKFEEEKNEDAKQKRHLEMMDCAYICASYLCVALDAEITR